MFHSQKENHYSGKFNHPCVNKSGSSSVLNFFCKQILNFILFFSIHPPPGLLPVLGLLERYVTLTLDAALLISSRAGADLGQMSDRLFISSLILNK